MRMVQRRDDGGLDQENSTAGVKNVQILYMFAGKLMIFATNWIWGMKVKEESGINLDICILTRFAVINWNRKTELGQNIRILYFDILVLKYNINPQIKGCINERELTYKTKTKSQRDMGKLRRDDW